MLTEKGTIVATFDDIICYTTYDLYLFLCQNYRFYGKYLNLFQLLTKKELYERDNESLIDFLKSDRMFGDLTPVMRYHAAMNLYKILYARYYSQTNEYPLTRLSKIGKYGLNNPRLRENKGINKIIFIVKYRTEKERIKKEAFIKKVYGSGIDAKYIPYDQPYDRVISKIKWTMLITDDIDCVEKLAAGDINHKEFLVPNYGYNKASRELNELIKLKEGTLSYYDPGF